jgi:hypothetical protein
MDNNDYITLQYNVGTQGWGAQSMGYRKKQETYKNKTRKGNL